MSRRGVIRWVPALFLIYSLPGPATTVYKSVDESGVVSFSDTLPEENQLLEAVEIDIEETPPDEQVQQRLEDMRKTTDRMATDRMAREKHRAEMRELQAKSDAMNAPRYYSNEYDYRTVYTGGYGYYPSRRYLRRPGHVRPPMRPVRQDNFPAPHIRPLFTPRTRGAPRR